MSTIWTSSTKEDWLLTIPTDLFFNNGRYESIFCAPTTIDLFIESKLWEIADDSLELIYKGKTNKILLKHKTFV